ncbi:MAG: AAA family ATPase [Epsilonproteobacteria bacterium]|nr:AAA family ATPase [Campylobacterota bacterium]
MNNEIENKPLYTDSIKDFAAKVKMQDMDSAEKVFEALIAAYKEHFGKVSKHCQISVDCDYYKGKQAIKSLVDRFLETKSKEDFEAFWQRSKINSVQQRSNATNMFKHSTLDEIYTGIKKIIDVKVTSQNAIEEIKNTLSGAKNSALELYFYYYMNDGDFPLINNGTMNGMKMLEEIGIFENENDLLQQFKILQEKICPNLLCGNLPKYFLVDQFLNLLDKIKFEDIKNVDIEFRQLYQLAYLITFWQNNKKHRNNFSDRFDELIGTHKNIIFYGAPGTGKTYTCEENIKRIVNGDTSRYKIIQFHSSYGYEDFMEGLKPTLENGQTTLKLEMGDFKSFCEDARKEPEKSFFFLVDEINRAELSRVFGELMYALEKRGHTITTQYDYLRKPEQRGDFQVPENLYFIGTMNDVDKSIDSFDLALRRRFLWERMDCEYGVLLDNLSYSNIDPYVKACEKLNDTITNDGRDKLGLGEIYEIGHAYFLRIKEYAKSSNEIKSAHMNSLFDEALAPLLKEYLRSEFSEKDIANEIKKLRKNFKIES